MVVANLQKEFFLGLNFKETYDLLQSLSQYLNAKFYEIFLHPEH